MTDKDHVPSQKSEGANTVIVDSELTVMARVSEALNSLPDATARERVICWATSIFVGLRGAATRPGPVAGILLKGINERGNSKEIPGIARVTENGELHLTVRDLKATSANDAAIRIAHLALCANKRLNQSESLSSKNVLVPILRRYRAYDGNTRSALAQHRGFIREGDRLSMDLHCEEEAEDFIRQILDPTSQGAWNPTAKTARRKRSPAQGIQPERDSSEV